MQQAQNHAVRFMKNSIRLLYKNKKMSLKIINNSDSWSFKNIEALPEVQKKVPPQTETAA